MPAAAVIGDTQARADGGQASTAGSDEVSFAAQVPTDIAEHSTTIGNADLQLYSGSVIGPNTSLSAYGEVGSPVGTDPTTTDFQSWGRPTLSLLPSDIVVDRATLALRSTCIIGDVKSRPVLTVGQENETWDANSDASDLGTSSVTPIGVAVPSGPSLTTSAVCVGTASTVEVTATVAGWVAGTTQNNGFAISIDTAQSAANLSSIISSDVLSVSWHYAPVLPAGLPTDVQTAALATLADPSNAGGAALSNGQNAGGDAQDTSAMALSAAINNVDNTPISSTVNPAYQSASAPVLTTAPTVVDPGATDPILNPATSAIAPPAGAAPASDDPNADLPSDADAAANPTPTDPGGFGPKHSIALPLVNVAGIQTPVSQDVPTTVTGPSTTDPGTSIPGTVSAGAPRSNSVNSVGVPPADNGSAPDCAKTLNGPAAQSSLVVNTSYFCTRKYINLQYMTCKSASGGGTGCSTDGTVQFNLVVGGVAGNGGRTVQFNGRVNITQITHGFENAYYDFTLNCQVFSRDPGQCADSSVERSWAQLEKNPNITWTATSPDVGAAPNQQDHIDTYNFYFQLQADAYGKYKYHFPISNTIGSQFRCDSASYLVNAGLANMGCTFNLAVPVMTLSVYDHSIENTLKHIYYAQHYGQYTAPSSPGKAAPGASDGTGTALTRVYYNKSLRTANGYDVKKTCNDYYSTPATATKPAVSYTVKGGGNFAPAHRNPYDCDEYPFSSTYQGASSYRNSSVKNYAADPDPHDDNQQAGSYLGQFYNEDRILDYIASFRVGPGQTSN